MVLRGHLRMGAIVLDDPVPPSIPDGARVTVQLATGEEAAKHSGETVVREGGQWRGRVRIAADFDELPDAL